MQSAFHQFRHAGLTLLAVPVDTSVWIIDSTGANYGTYHSKESALAFWHRNGGISNCRIGSACLRVIPFQK